MDWSPAFPLTPKRTFLRPKNLSKTSRIFGLGVSKIPALSCLRPFIHSRTYSLRAHQALRPAFPLTPKRTFLHPKNVSNTSRIFGLGVRKIPNFGCIRPFVFSRTYMNAQQALRPVKYYFVCMKISRPVEAGCLGSRRILTYFHSYI